MDSVNKKDEIASVGVRIECLLASSRTRKGYRLKEIDFHAK